ncbi:hypothetical protein M0R45_017887 [Rubus argutus]|uniref:Uncharacterized protein n=1 Tax=Rubus argutus TaxID=59490 RepID=A0AAW1XX81_RUBAR
MMVSQEKQHSKLLVACVSPARPPVCLCVYKSHKCNIEILVCWEVQWSERRAKLPADHLRVTELEIADIEDDSEVSDFLMSGVVVVVDEEIEISVGGGLVVRHLSRDSTLRCG